MELGVVGVSGHNVLSPVELSPMEEHRPEPEPATTLPHSTVERTAMETAVNLKHVEQIPVRPSVLIQREQILVARVLINVAWTMVTVHQMVNVKEVCSVESLAIVRLQD